MSRIKPAMLTVLAVLAASAISAGHASANDACHLSVSEPFEVCAQSATNPLVFEELVSPTAHEFGTEGALLATSKLTSKILGLAAEVECKEVQFTVKGTDQGVLGQPVQPGATKFLRCKVNKPAHCKLTSAEEKEIKFNVQTQLEEEGAPKVGFELWGEKGGPETGREEEELVSLTIEDNGSGQCIIKPPLTLKLKGSQWCEMTKATEHSEFHEVVCAGANSELKLGESEAKLEVTLTHLEPLPSDSWDELWFIGQS